MTYQPPVKLITYLLRHCVNAPSLEGTDAFPDFGEELMSDIVSGASEFAANVIAPSNRDGDLHGATLKNDAVTTAPGFKDVYRSFVEAGWQGIAAPADIGGMGLPQTLAVGVNEMLYSANMAFGLAPMLTASAMNAIHAHATDDLKAMYLPKMVSGEWSGAMNLTEPQAGSDLGVLRAKASPNADGTYAVSGQKIFITWGDHDCAGNIVHLVLARLPDAPEGSRGISLFLVPKIMVNDDGSLGKRNTVKAIGLEHKLGIHGSPTCVMEFASATGWLVGPPNKGLACMFTMMNEARLFVGVQGVAIGERAYQQALEFANDRVQGKVLGEAGPSPIVGHPDVRRMLLDMKTGLMGARAIAMATAMAEDMSHTSSGDEAKAHKARAELLTPITKAYGSDMGVSVASIGVQIHGGMGFVEETGAAQHYRDARIAPIYEGTNGIQAIDLIGRKLRRDGCDAMAALIVELKATLADTKVIQDADGHDFGCKIRHLSVGIDALEQATAIILKADDKDALAVATQYLELCGHVIAGGLLIKSVLNGYKAQDPHAATMHKLVWHHALTYLAKAPSALDAIEHGAAPVFAVNQSHLADI